MSPEIKISVSEADVKQIEEIKEYNSKVRCQCRKARTCTTLLTFLFVILAIGLTGFYILRDKPYHVVVSFGIFFSLAMVAQAIWYIATVILTNYIEKGLFINEDEECIGRVLSGEDVSPLLDKGFGIYCQLHNPVGHIGNIYLDVINEIPDTEKIVLKFTAQNKRVYGWRAEKGE